MSMPQVLDPNWFYSSLAQASASVVGLFGAILATRLQSQLEKAATQQILVNNSLQRLTDLARPIFDRLQLYAQHSPQQMELIKAGIQECGGPRTEARWYSPYDMGASNVQFEADPHFLEVELARTKLTLAVLPHLERLLQSADPRSLDEFGPAVEPHLLEAAEGMPPQIRSVAKLASDASGQLAILSLQTRQTGFSALWLCLIVLSLSLVAPLLFLTAYSELHKLALTAALAVGLAILLIYLRMQISSLRDLGTYMALTPPRPKRPGAALTR
jgi:hypothetical protein